MDYGVECSVLQKNEDFIAISYHLFYHPFDLSLLRKKMKPSKKTV